jgi:glycosyltransferase involved in cell wall biosynthesis
MEYWLQPMPCGENRSIPVRRSMMLPESVPSARSDAIDNEPPRILALFGSAVVFGAERGNLEALMALKAQGAEVLCLIRDEGWSTIVPSALDARGIVWRKVPYVEQWRRHRAHVIFLRGPWAWLLANWRFLSALHSFKPTHIHAYSQWFVVNFLIGLWLTKTPLVFRAGDEPTTHNACWRATWRYTVSRTTQFVANSEFVERSLRVHGVPSDRITVIYNKPPGRPKLVSRGLKFEFSKGARVFAFVGQIAEHKGPHLLVAAFRRLASEFPETHLVLAGRISGWIGDAWARALRERAANDPLIANRVTFLGEVEDVPALLARSEILVVPSLFEDPSPNVIMEAKLAGRACIGFPRGGIPELIENGVDGLMCQDASEEALVVVLRKYCEDATLAARHGANGRNTVSRFGHAQFADRWSAVYALAEGRTTDAIKSSGETEEIL